MSAAYSRRQETIRQHRPDPVSRPVTQTGTRAITRQVTRPVTRQATRPATRPVTRQVTRPVTRQTTRPVTRPINRQNRSRNTAKPQLRVVQPVTRSKFSKVTLVIVTLASLFGFIVIFQTVIAEQQLRLDKVSTDVRLARQHYNELRQQRAELRAPDYLRAQAIMLGMWPGSGAKFEEIPAEVVTMVLASTGDMDDSIALPRNSDELVLESTGSAP
ncbi:MAG: hypothetical protein EBT42_04020 [Actinobacteria bacterium]|nr:hypothetical protein [Actinomycetota bacterium]